MKFVFVMKAYKNISKKSSLDEQNNQNRIENQQTQSTYDGWVIKSNPGHIS